MLTIRKRGSNWHVRGTVRVGKETRTVGEHSTGSRKRSSAEDYRSTLEAEIRQELLHGSAGRERHVTFADAGILYLNRPGGVHRMDAWRIGQLGRVISDNTFVDIKDGWAKFKAVRCAGLKPATVDRFRKIAQAVMNYAADEWGLARVSLPAIRYSNERIRYLNEAQREALLGAYTPHVRPIALMLCFQGCRTQEALQLTWPNVDFGAQTIYFDRTKNDEPRTVPMQKRVFEALNELWEGQGRPDTGHVFRNRFGEPYADTRNYRLPGGNPIAKAHQTACRRAGIEDFRVHDWRHHWASWCMMADPPIDMETIKRMGGWKSLAMLERYAAVSTVHMKEAIRRIA